jgi:uncharacterized protein
MKDTGRAKILNGIAAIRQELRERFSVVRIGIFGSYARGSAHMESDVDVVVELAEPTFDHYMDLKFRLEEALQKTVDLVMADAVKPRLKEIIDREAVYV